MNNLRGRDKKDRKTGRSGILCTGLFRYGRTTVSFAIPAVLVIIALSVFWTSSVPSRAEEEPETVRVGYYENEVFQEGASEGAVKTGYAYEYYRKLSEYTGWKYEYVYGGFGDLYQMLLDGEIDLLAGLAWREERAGIIGYPDAIMGSESYYLVKHDSRTGITADPSTMKGKKIGVLDSAMVGVLEQYLEDHYVKADVITYQDHEELFSAFDSGELDLFVAESDGAHGREHAEVLCAFGASEYYLCVNKKRPDLLKELNTAQTLLAAEEPNYLSSLGEKYYSLSVSAQAFSEAEREWMSTHDKLCVGYLNHFLPYSDTDESGNPTGIVTDIIPGIMDALGMTDKKVSFRSYESYDDMVGDMGKGIIDLAFPVGGGLYYSEENGIYQSNPVASAPTEIVYKGTYSEECVKHFAVNENNRMQYYYVQTNYPDAKISFYSSAEDCLKAVINGEVGSTTLDGLRASDMMKNGKYRSLSLYQSTESDDRCFGVKIGNEGLLKLLNRGINILGSDYAQNISYKYVSGLYSYNLWDVIRDNFGIFAAIFLGVVLLIIFFLLRDSLRNKREAKEKEEARLRLEESNKELAKSKEALSEALITAEQASRAKTTFLNNVSHDIRTPMNAIMGFTALANAHIDNQEEVRDYLDKITVSGQYLLALINDVLDMSRIESGKVTIDAVDAHLPDIIRNLQTIVESNISDKKLEFIVDTKDVVHEDIVTDKLRLNQVLLNILSNAIKFTPEGGTINFRVIEKDSDREGWTNMEFRIKDNGIGMSPEFRDMIFEAFSREKSSTVSGIQGTGLGMSITKNIVDMMGGEITVSSEEGKGSEFVVLLPCRISEGFDEAGEGKKGASPFSFEGKRVLLAEDNEMNQMIASAILNEAGFTVEIACDGAEAVEKIKENPAGYFDVVLMDIQMPNMDGYEAAKTIRALDDPDKSGIPIIAVTANAFKEDRENALESGMNGHLAKPYDVEVIMKTLHQILS